MRISKFVGLIVPLVAIVSSACTDEIDVPSPGTTIGALADDATPRSYLVALADSAVPAAFARAAGVTPDFVYEHALKGFSVTIAPQAAEALARRPGVLSVTPDITAHIVGQQVPTGIARIGGPAAVTGAVQVPGIAIIDTGIGDVPDLNVVQRVVCSKGTRTTPAACTAGGTDDNNHGTHVAGTAAAIDDGFGVVGVYPGAPLYAVKVCNSRGSCAVSQIVAGIDWVVARASAIPIPIRVINMSLSYAGTSDAASCATTTNAFYLAICGAQAAGVTVVVAAGNETDDAANHLPAGYPEVLTVSALNDADGAKSGDTFASFSNYGSVVDIMAPGVGILSTLPDGSYASYSGTSMATPHVTGAAARILAANPSYTPADVRAALLAQADPDPCPTTSGLCAGDPDGIIEPLVWIGAPIEYCTSDAECTPGVCNGSGVCVQPACSNIAGECDDADPCTADSCTSPGTATATCDHTYNLCGLSDFCCGPQCSGDMSSDHYDLDCPTASAWMHVQDIYFRVSGKRGYQAFVTIVDSSGQAVEGATVAGSSQGTAIGTIQFSIVTDSTGTAKVLDLVSNVLEVIRTEVTSVTHPTMSYDQAANVQTCATFDMATKTEGSCN